MEIFLSIVLFAVIALALVFCIAKGVEKIVLNRTETPEQREFFIKKAERKSFKKMMKVNAKMRGKLDTYEDVEVDKAARLHQQRSK